MSKPTEKDKDKLLKDIWIMVSNPNTTAFQALDILVSIGVMVHSRYIKPSEDAAGEEHANGE